MIDIEDIYRDTSRELYFYIYKLSNSSDIAEEVVQETFYRALEQVLLGKENLSKGWFYTVARNVFFDYVRRQNKQIYTNEINELIDNNSPPSLINMEKGIEKEELLKLLNKMKENYRTVLILREIREYSYEEIAKIMNLSISNVKITLFRARNSFKKLYEEKNKP